MREFIVQIDFEDRPRLGYDVFEVFEKHGIDKIAMEVGSVDGMMIKFRLAEGQSGEPLLSDLASLSGVLTVRFREQMPYEEREHELKTILNSVSEGIVAVNRDRKITHINEVACGLFHVTEKEALNLTADDLFTGNPPLVETLATGRSYSLMERKIRRNGHLIHFMTSGVPVLNKKGQIIGAVATIKDFRQVQEILSKMDKGRRLTTFEDIICQSEEMVGLVGAARMVAKGSSTVLLRGESGTGKELFATAIHVESPRRKGPFVAINCGALPDSLLESELFGYEEGAFTGAAKGGRKGLFEQAKGGTLFLDEIGEISPQVQVRLLRVLQGGAVRRVGGGGEIPVDVRVVAATNRNLEEMIRKGEFREDLYYRLNVIPLQIPPLRERREDIPLIAQHLLRKICARLGKDEVRLTRETVEILSAQDWPGNVRQLENALERLVNLVDAAEILPEHLYAWTDIGKEKARAAAGNGDGSKQGERQGVRNGGGTLDVRDAREDVLHVEIPKQGEWPPLKEIVAQVEKEVITRVLERYPSSRLAGQVLGVSNTTVLNKMRAYGIH
ncbi:RNA polymerase sigma factor 54 interaction domain protein [Acididesulfobacillus acetoxydans]|uniref:HTH-type transcriptional regulatory protein TyrR n=1 Tax=Acididesulfobacillus acetoxydans TaxID=1561005 RepID=A0A8S0Y3K2_9FIRM|nr:sigma 54-interacting transcriptional regulator [Acididesulfobacillus acetoxydans]CAA7602155.1 RNA polymerase sigma factor 54 interaction domain protein [Acididesulfobacillus acetoxydans]CEJ08001.1 Signal-transduction and transcriptional-control protein [Acididesulfobacillus acetoxydans]